MTTNIKALILAGMLLPGAALAQIQTGDVLGASEADIRAAIEAKGYVITEIEFEEDELEIEAELNGQAFEIEIARASGTVLEIELDDDDDDGDDD